MHKSLKERLKEGEVVLGTWCVIPSSSLVDAIGSSGIDFVILDGEHGPFDYQVTEDCVRAAEVSGTAPIIRVLANESSLILKALDTGAIGVQVPHVSNGQQAREVVKSAKYAPLGERGYTPMTRAGKYGRDAQGHAKRSNDKTMVVINIEGIDGINHLEEIIEVPAIDVIFIGPYDLSQSLGIPGEVEHPKIIEKIKESAEIIKSKNIACGSYAGNEQFMDILVDCGVQYITYDVDSDMIRRAYEQVLLKANKRQMVPK